MTGRWIIREIMHTRGGDAVTTRSGVAVTPRVCIIFLIIQRLRVNYSAYTSVTTAQDIDQMIFQGIRPFFLLQSLLWVGLFILNRNRGLSRW